MQHLLHKQSPYGHHAHVSYPAPPPFARTGATLPPAGLTPPSPYTARQHLHAHPIIESPSSPYPGYQYPSYGSGASGYWPNARRGVRVVG
jgi:hypothetical protein